MNSPEQQCRRHPLNHDLQIDQIQSVTDKGISHIDWPTLTVRIQTSPVLTHEI